MILVTDDREEPLSLGEQATALTQGSETVEALIARANAQRLVADCLWNTDSARATDAAILALSLFRQVTDACANLDATTLYDINLDSARLNSLLGRADEGLRRCEQALRLAPDKEQTVICLTELGTIYRNAGRLAEARATFAKAVKSPGLVPYTLVRPYFELGLVERELGKLPEARAKLQKGLQILQDDPALPRVYLPELLGPIAEISYELGDFGEAARSFQALVDFYPVSESFHWGWLQWLGRCQWDLGQFELARTNLEQIAESDLAPEDDRTNARTVLRGVKASIAQSHYDSRDYTSCIAECESLLPQFAEGDESYLSLLLLLGHSYAGIRKNSPAQKCYEAILASSAALPTHRAIAERCLTRLSASRG